VHNVSVWLCRQVEVENVKGRARNGSRSYAFHIFPFVMTSSQISVSDVHIGYSTIWSEFCECNKQTHSRQGIFYYCIMCMLLAANWWHLRLGATAWLKCALDLIVGSTLHAKSIDWYGYYHKRRLGVWSICQNWFHICSDGSYSMPSCPLSTTTEISIADWGCSVLLLEDCIHQFNEHIW